MSKTLNVASACKAPRESNIHDWEASLSKIPRASRRFSRISQDILVPATPVYESKPSRECQRFNIKDSRKKTQIWTWRLLSPGRSVHQSWRSPIEGEPFQRAESSGGARRSLSHARTTVGYVLKGAVVVVRHSKAFQAAANVHY